MNRQSERKEGALIISGHPISGPHTPFADLDLLLTESAMATIEASEPDADVEPEQDVLERAMEEQILGALVHP